MDTTPADRDLLFKGAVGLGRALGADIAIETQIALTTVLAKWADTFSQITPRTAGISLFHGMAHGLSTLLHAAAVNVYINASTNAPDDFDDDAKHAHGHNAVNAFLSDFMDLLERRMNEREVCKINLKEDGIEVDKTNPAASHAEFRERQAKLRAERAN